MHNKVKLYGAWDHYPLYTTVQDAEGQFQKSNSKKFRGWAGWRPVSEDEKAKFKKVKGADGTEGGKSLVEIQKQIEEAAKTINYSTKVMRHNAEKETPDKVTDREKAAARSERPM